MLSAPRNAKGTLIKRQLVSSSNRGEATYTSPIVLMQLIFFPLMLCVFVSSLT